MAVKGKDRLEAERELRQRIREMAKGDPREAVDGLLKLLNDRNRWVVREAVKALGGLDPYAAAAAVPELIELYHHLDGDGKKRDPLCDIRKSIVSTLGHLGARAGMDTVRRAIKTVQIEAVGFGMEDTGLDLRATAALVLAELSDDTASTLCDLAVLLFDTEPNPSVPADEYHYAKAAARKAAAKAIAALGDPAGAAPLTAKLAFSKGEVQEVQAECIEALAALKPTQLTDLLIPFLEGHDPYLAAVSATAMAGSLGAGALEPLAAAVDRVVPEARAPVVYAIGSIRCEGTGKALIPFFTHPDEDVRMAALEGASLYMSPAVMAAAAVCAEEDDSPAVRAAARRLMG